MSEETPAVPAPVLPSSSKLITALGAIAMISGLLVAVTYQFTAPIIKVNQQKALERAIFQVLPEAVTSANFRLEGNELTALTTEQFADANVFVGYDAERALVGVALEGSARGYQDVVRILYAYDPAEQGILGFTVLQSSETPGIGDKVETDDAFLANFDPLDARLNAAGDDLANPIITVKNGRKVNPWEIDAISGATITSAAVGDALNESASRMLPPLMANQNLLTTPKGDD
jgi:Na+-translocating ferredoxin:NAD+ oxidoreductase subunit G